MKFSALIVLALTGVEKLLYYIFKIDPYLITDRNLLLLKVHFKNCSFLDNRSESTFTKLHLKTDHF